MTPILDKLRDCPVLTTIETIGGKWRTRILWHLRQGPTRFGTLQRNIDVSEKVLAQNLKALERAAVVARREYKQGQVVVTEYSYTDYGQSLIPVLDAMGAWGINHAAKRGLSQRDAE